MASELDLGKIPELVGLDDEFKRCLHILSSSRQALFLIGPSGTGKTVFAQNLAGAYAEKRSVKAYYVQGAPETTKTSLIAGLRMQQGSLVPTKSIVAQAMEEGAIVIVDEAPHMMQEVLLMFNSIMDRWSVTSIGDIAVTAGDTFRIVFCGNPTTHAGNTALPQSFATRLYAVVFDYPSFGQEDRIVRAIVKDQYSKRDKVPNEVRRYVIGLFRKYRTPSYPLVARNMAAGVIALNAELRFADDDTEPYTITNEAVAVNIGRLSRTKEEELPDTVRVFQEFLGKVPLKRFRRCIEQAAMVHLDIEAGSDISARHRLAAAILTHEEQQPDPDGT